ncbi:MAG: hypothetical protein I8H75_06140 [Myxococcaceae bacterium]|nr:hypothetical protein [Myxococcaceae bacterium]MBH2006894.1 hypothetical protein [Myxococcaceae bacterium]
MSADPRKIAAQVLEQIFKNRAYSKHALSAALDASRLDSRDKGFCTELVYGALRWAPVLEKSLLRAMDRPNPKLALDLKCHLLVAAYQIQHLADTIPAYAAVSSAVQLIKRKRPGLGGFANAILRRLGSSPHGTLGADSSLEAIEEGTGCPRFLLETLPVSKRVEAAIAMNDRPQTWYWTPEGNGNHAFVPTATTVAQTWVQDPASQIAALLVGAQCGEWVVDACAAPGSKSRLLKHAVGESGRVLAIDQNIKRLERVDANIERLAGDFRVLEPQIADAVLLDAPCSGYGTLRRHPEIKLWRGFESVQELAVLQAELLERAALWVKPGGVLVYSVCSPLPEEGQEPITRFLSKHSDFKLSDPRETLPWLPEHAVVQQTVRLWPHKDQTDAFFAARLIRS